MPSIRFFKSSLYFKLFAIALLTPEIAQATTGLGAIGDLFEGLWYLLLFVFGISTAFLLLLAYRNGHSGDRKLPLMLTACLVLFILFASRRFYFEPEFNLETLITVLCTLLFCLGAIYYPGKSRVVNYKAAGFMLFALLFMLLNPKIITYNNHIFVDDPPFDSTLTTTAPTHPIFNQSLLGPSARSNPGYAEFMQTSDGSLYYGTSSHGLDDEGTIINRVPADNCDAVCQNCSGDCFDFYIAYQTHYLLWKPVSHIDFQKNHNFPKAPYSTIPSKTLVRPIINIPIKDKYINPNSAWHRGTLKLVSQQGTVVWNPLNHWLWTGLCEGNGNSEEIDDLVWDNIDPNYAPNEYSLTLFNCAIEKVSFEKVKLLSTLGADPNYKVNVGKDRDVNSMFVVMAQRIDLAKKKELFEFLIDIGVDINAQSKNGSTLLHTLVDAEGIENKVSLAKLLLSLGVDKNSASYSGRTPIELARYRRDSFTTYKKELEQETDWVEQQKKWNLDRMQRIITESSAIVTLLERE